MLTVCIQSVSSCLEEIGKPQKCLQGKGWALTAGRVRSASYDYGHLTDGYWGTLMTLIV